MVRMGVTCELSVLEARTRRVRKFLLSTAAFILHTMPPCLRLALVDSSCPQLACWLAHSVRAALVYHVLHTSPAC